MSTPAIPVQKTIRKRPRLGDESMRDPWYLTCRHHYLNAQQAAALRGVCKDLHSVADCRDTPMDGSASLTRNHAKNKRVLKALTNVTFRTLTLSITVRPCASFDDVLTASTKLNSLLNLFLPHVAHDKLMICTDHPFTHVVAVPVDTLDVAIAASDLYAAPWAVSKPRMTLRKLVCRVAGRGTVTFHCSVRDVRTITES